MALNRRAFLQRAALAAAALTVDPEQLLWTPGQRSYFDLGEKLLPLSYRLAWADWKYHPGYLLATRVGLVSWGDRMHTIQLQATPQEAAGPGWAIVQFEKTQKAEKELRTYLRQLQQHQQAFR